MQTRQGSILTSRPCTLGSRTLRDLGFVTVSTRMWEPCGLWVKNCDPKVQVPPLLVFTLRFLHKPLRLLSFDDLVCGVMLLPAATPASRAVVRDNEGSTAFQEHHSRMGHRAASALDSAMGSSPRTGFSLPLCQTEGKSHDSSRHFNLTSLSWVIHIFGSE